MHSSVTPFVSIVMPALDEERYIASAIASLLPGDDCGFEYELIVVDGGSRDATPKIVQMLARGNPSIRLLHNDKRIPSAAVNRAAEAADPRSTVLLRADCHAVYPPSFVSTCVMALAESRTASVVVPMHTVGASCMQRAIAAAQNSRLGNGGAAHRRPGASCYVDHGHHAAFDRRIFMKLGGYDEDFVHNEDAEFDRRLAIAGFRIWLCGDAAITYFPRATLVSLARQYFGYGAGRAKTAMKQDMALLPRQLLPVAALLGCLAAAALSLVQPALLLVDALYVAACIIYGLAVAVRSRTLCAMLSGVAAIVMHMAWASGFLQARIAARSWRQRIVQTPRGAPAGGADPR